MNQQIQQQQQLQFHQRSQQQQSAIANVGGGCGGSGMDQQQPTQIQQQNGGYNPQQQQQIYQQYQQQQQQSQAEALATAALQNVYANYGGSPSAAAISNNNLMGQIQQQQQIQPPMMRMMANYSGQIQMQPQSLFVASCPPLSKPLLDQTGLGHSCSTYDRCPNGFTCYSNFPDGRNAHCCTTVPLDNQVVFRANTALSLLDEENQQKMLAISMQPSAGNNPFGPQFSPTKIVENGRNSEEENVTIPIQSAATNLNQTHQILGKMNGCPNNMINIGGYCKRSESIFEKKIYILFIPFKCSSLANPVANGTVNVWHGQMEPVV
jgi:hypothetical protein